MPDTLRHQLRQYGLERMVAQAGAATLTAPAYFGVKRNGSRAAFEFTDDLQTIHEDAMNLGMVVPDNQTFDLMAPAEFGLGLADQSPKTIRKFLSDLLDAL